MKGPNGKSVVLNRATVSISATIYDRRALDCTDNKALVNSLNHLTFLTSSSVKVRDAMIHDGAIERLVGILYECRDPKNNTDSIMFAWKWVLALQCLVLAGTRGSEKMRKKLVDAGIIPILATILDNHFLTKKSSIKADLNPVQQRSAYDERSILTRNRSRSNTNNAIGSTTAAATTSTTPVSATSTTNSDGNNIITNESSYDHSLQNPHMINDSNNVATAEEEEMIDLEGELDVQDDDGQVVVLESELEDADHDNNFIENVLRQIRNSVDRTDEAIFDANTTIDEFSSKQSHSNFNNSLNVLGDEEIELLNVIELVKCFQKLSDCSLNVDVMKLVKNNFKNLLNDPLLSNELNQRLEISNILTPESDPFNNLIDSNLVSHTVPRTFENGLILPATDDVIWSLQLLAFISKYTYLRQPLCNTYLINGLSFRSRNHPPPLETDSASVDLDEVMTDSNDDSFIMPSVNSDITNSDGADNTNSFNDNNSNNNNSNFDFTSNFNVINLQNFTTSNNYNNNINYSLILEQNERLKNIKKLSDENDKGIIEDYFKILKTNNQLEKIRYLEKIRLNSTRLKHESLGKLRSKNKFIYRNKLEQYSEKWDYDNAWEEFETPLEISNLIDRDIQPFVTLNIFPLVERFTVKTWFQEDICYWAAVVVRNANRKDEKMGGRRQCANFNCGKWEDHPKQFSKCRRCKRAKYCSRECQAKAWVFHKHWCVPAMHAVNYSDSSNTGTNTNSNTSTHNTNNSNNNITNSTSSLNNDNFSDTNIANSAVLSTNMNNAVATNTATIPAITNSSVQDSVNPTNSDTSHIHNYNQPYNGSDGNIFGRSELTSVPSGSGTGLNMVNSSLGRSGAVSQNVSSGTTPSFVSDAVVSEEYTNQQEGSSSQGSNVRDD